MLKRKVSRHLESRVALFRDMKAAGGKAEDVWRNWERLRAEAARDGGWRPSELAMTLAGDQEAFEIAYGIRAATRAFNATRKDK